MEALVIAMVAIFQNYKIVDSPRPFLALLSVRRCCLRPKHIVQDLNILFEGLKTPEYAIYFFETASFVIERGPTPQIVSGFQEGPVELLMLLSGICVCAFHLQSHWTG